MTVVARALFVSLLVSVIVAPGPSSAAVSRSDDDHSYVNPRYDGAATLAIEGTLEKVADTVPGTDEYVYAVRTDEGDVIGVPASFGDGAPVGGRFEGEIALVEKVAEEVRDGGVAVAEGKTIDSDTAVGQTVMAVLAEQETPAPVASATVTEPIAAAATPSMHRAYVAIITNLGSVPSASAIDDSLSYWDDEAGDAISSFTVAQTKQYASDAGDPGSSSANIPTCGLEDYEWEDVWSEADGKFSPAIDFGPRSGNHLIVLVPSVCGSGTVGIGTVGGSIADGGLSIVAVTGGVDQTGAHEIGHNFGLGHANLESCATSCVIRDYYNAYSVMGLSINDDSPPVLDTATRETLELADEVDVISATGETTVELKPRSDASGRRGLQVIDPTTQAEYFVDYRSGTGRDATAFYATGGNLGSFSYAPGIVITDQTSGKQTKVLTRRIGSFYKAYLSPGESYTSSGGGVRVAAGDTPGVVTVTLSTPVASSAPTVSPTVARVALIMTAKTNTWTPGTAFTYQWRVNGTAVTGATGPTYEPTAASYKKKLTVSVTGSNDGYLNVTRTSASYTIAVGHLVPVVPTVSGTHRVGRTLKVVPGTWKYGPKLTYRWYANGKAISRATKSSYKITKGKKGKYITVRVSAKKTGFVSTGRTSLRVTKVR